MIGYRTRVVDTQTQQIRHEFDLRRTTHIVFSPLDTHLVTYQPYQIYGPKVGRREFRNSSAEFSKLLTKTCKLVYHILRKSIFLILLEKVHYFFRRGDLRVTFWGVCSSVIKCCLFQTSENQKPDPNMRVFCLKTGECLSTMIAQKKDTWEPQWTADESIVARMTGGEIFFHYKANFTGLSAIHFNSSGAFEEFN